MRFVKVLFLSNEDINNRGFMGFGNLSRPGFGEQIARWREEYYKLFYEGCGICEKKVDPRDGFVYWFTENRSIAHVVCFKKIQHLEENLTRTIHHLFYNSQLNKSENFKNFRCAHVQAIKAVKIACGSESILTYLEKNGETRLAHLFNTVRIESAKQMVAKL